MTDRFHDRQHAAIVQQVAELVKSGEVRADRATAEVQRRFREYRNCFPE